MDQLNHHDHSSEWKEPMDAISEYMEVIVDIVTSNLSGYCKLLYLKKNSLAIQDLIRINDELLEYENPDKTFWWSEWMGLQTFLESRFEIRIPKREDCEPQIINDSMIKNMGISFHLPIEKLAEIVSILVAGERIPNDYFYFLETSIEIENEES